MSLPDVEVIPSQDPRYLWRMQVEPLLQPPKIDALTRLDLEPGQTILDVGCGVGGNPAVMARYMVEGLVIGVDTNDNMIEEARRELPRGLTDRVVFIHADAQDLEPFEDGVFDALHSERTYQHVPDTDAALASAMRVVRPGGRIVIVDTNWSKIEFEGDRDAAWLKSLYQEEVTHPGLAGQLGSRLRALGLRDVVDTPHMIETTSYKKANEIVRQELMIPRSRDTGVIQDDGVARGVRMLDRMRTSNDFALRLPLHVVSGIKPVRRR